VLSVPAKFTTAEQNYTARLGDAVAMDCLSEGDRPLSIAWSFNHGSIDWQYNTRSLSPCHLLVELLYSIDLKNVLTFLKILVLFYVF